MHQEREKQLHEYVKYLYENEKSEATIEKYKRELQRLFVFLESRELTKEILVEYRQKLQETYQVRTVNGKISAINSFLEFIESDFRVKFLRVQKNVFVEEKRELTENDYKKLLHVAKQQGRERLYHIMLTMAGTGIRVSELRFITVETVRKGKAQINMKGKNRVILIQNELRKKLLYYIGREGVKHGCIFQTKNGEPVDRSNIYHELKRLCEAAHVKKEKVFPHNFRHLFARTFYKVEKNLSHLADILGHSSIETTRIYITASEGVYKRTLNKMRLII